MDFFLRPFEVTTTVLEKFIEDHDVTGWPMPSWGRFHFFNHQNQVDWDVLLYYISITPAYIFPKQCWNMMIVDYHQERKHVGNIPSES